MQCTALSQSRPRTASSVRKTLNRKSQAMHCSTRVRKEKGLGPKRKQKSSDSIGSANSRMRRGRDRRVTGRRRSETVMTGLLVGETVGAVVEEAVLAFVEHRVMVVSDFVVVKDIEESASCAE